MPMLESGQILKTISGVRIRVEEFIAEGGQGEVYRVDYNGEKKALKWYKPEALRDPILFYDNLKNNAAKGSPDKAFLWPDAVTEKSGGTFGYIMELKPDGFDSFVDILNTYKLEIDPLTGRGVKRPVKFNTLSAMVTCVINIVNAFRQLHRAGKSYQDLNDGGFFINVNTGAVLVCDCDNIAPDGSNFGIGGKPGYMAPEVVRGIAQPNVQTDKYSLAVVLFKLLFRGDPMEGEKVVRDVCLTESSELKHYGQNAVFVYDPDDDSNRPVRGIHDNIIKFWRIYPDYIKDAFIRSFTTGISDPTKRIIENEWQKLFIRLRSEIIQCGCGRTNFSSMFIHQNEKTFKCPKCGMEFVTIGFSNRKYRTPLYLGCTFYTCEIIPESDDFTAVAGELVENKLKPGVLGIKNCSDRQWKAKMPDGKFYDITPGKGFPVWQGLEIDFGEVKAQI